MTLDDFISDFERRLREDGWRIVREGEEDSVTLKVVWTGNFYRIMRREETRGGLVSWRRHTSETFACHDVAAVALYTMQLMPLESKKKRQ